MRKLASKRGIIIKGAFILTLTGFLSRFIGFFYRIFLSQSFGAEGMGLYQLIFPIYALLFSFTVAGIETALSRSVATKISLGREQEAKQLLSAALFVSVILSCAATIFLQANAAWFADRILGDVRCEPLLVAMSYSFPFAAVHSCICGYYFGLKQTGVPAISQLIEQVVRVVSVYAIYLFATKKSIEINITVAAVGLVTGEIASTIFCVKAFSYSHRSHVRQKFKPRTYFTQLKSLMQLSAPLTANRMLLNILQSIEAISIPARLLLSGMNMNEALSTYGVLTGMALPCILFPSAITNSVSTMMMPTVAEVQAADNHSQLTSLIKKVSLYCFLLGSACCIFFLLTGQFMGTRLFHSPSAGKFIITLAWICPFQYTNSTLLSVINGLGKTSISFFINTAGLTIRIASVFILIPAVGILGYLWGLLLSQLIVTLLCIGCLKRQLSKPNL